MWHKHGDPLYADSKKIGGLPNGEHKRRGYKMVCPVTNITKASPITDPKIERSDNCHKSLLINHGLRDGSKRSRRQWEHRKIANAQPGEIVHHIDLDPSNNMIDNLHVFESPKQHAIAHRSLELIAANMVKDGSVIFDRHSGLYRLAQS